MRTYLITFCLILLPHSLCVAQESETVWDEARRRQHLQLRQDSTAWDLGLLANDLERNRQSGTSRPFNFGAFPVPQYDLTGPDSFKGVGVGGNFTGIDLDGKRIVYSYFFVNKNTLNAPYLADKPDEVFFTLILLTNLVDTVGFSHADVHVVSRNNPDYVGQGFFKTANDQIDYVTFLTAERDAYAIVNLRLFDLKYGRTVLIAPQKDGSLRSMQADGPLLESGEVDRYVQSLLERPDVHAFFMDDGAI